MIPSSHLRRVPARVSPSAFTLLELLVAMAILAMLLVILLGVVDGTTKVWRQTEGRVDSYREARAAMNLIVSDLSTLYAAREDKIFKFDEDANRVEFLSRIPVDFQEHDEDAGSPRDNRSEICEIGYRRKFARTTSRGDETYNLYRTFRSSDLTFSKYRNNELFTGTTGEELVARNISDFKISALTVDPVTGAISKFDPAKNPFPDLLEVTLTALNTDAVKRFKSQSDWSNRTSPTYLANARTFTARVRLESKAANEATPSPTPSPTP